MSELLLNQGKTKRKDFYYFTENTFNDIRYGVLKILFRDQDKWFRSVNSVLTPSSVSSVLHGLNAPARSRVIRREA